MKKGKNFSCNNTGKRHKSDFYQTPYSLTDLLLTKESLVGNVLEPACGNNAIVDRLPYCTEYYDREHNFLSEQRHDYFDTIITNPPFSLAKEFIIKAKEIATQKIMFLLPLSYLHGIERYKDIWQDNKFPLKTVYVFTRYPMLEETVRPDGKHKTGMMVYAWFVWDKKYNGNPKIDWLNNNEYILKEKSKKNA